MQSNGGNGWYSTGGRANWFFGGAATLLGESSNSTYRIFSKGYGFSPWVYPGGYPQTANFKQYSIGKLGQGLGVVSFVASSAMEVRGMLIHKDNPESPNAVHPAKGISNIAIGAYGTWVNPVFGVFYFGMESFYPGGIGNGYNSGFLYDLNTVQSELNQMTNYQFRLVPFGPK